jgi:hypothetical protein
MFSQTLPEGLNTSRVRREGNCRKVSYPRNFSRLLRVTVDHTNDRLKNQSENDDLSVHRLSL